MKPEHLDFAAVWLGWVGILSVTFAESRMSMLEIYGALVALVVAVVWALVRVHRRQARARRRRERRHAERMAEIDRKYEERRAEIDREYAERREALQRSWGLAKQAHQRERAEHWQRVFEAQVTLGKEHAEAFLAVPPVPEELRDILGACRGCGAWATFYHYEGCPKRWNVEPGDEARLVDPNGPVEVFRNGQPFAMAASMKDWQEYKARGLALREERGQEGN